MKQPLQGWDLATWRVTQSQSGFPANIVSIVEINGFIDVEQLTSRVEKLVQTHPVLSCTVSDTDPVHLYPIPDFDFSRYISRTAEPVNTVAGRLANLRIGPNDCLWRIEIHISGGKSFLICALNHAIADGNRAMVIMQSLFDEPREINFQKEAPSDGKDGFEEIKDTLNQLLIRLVRDPSGLARDIGELTQSFTRVFATNSKIDERKASQDLRNYFYKIDKRQMQNYLQGKQVSSHDVMVAIVVCSLQKYFANAANPNESFLVNVPVAMNIDDGSSNKILVARVNFPSGVHAAPDMMGLSRNELRKWRSEPSLKLAAAALRASQLLPVEFIVNTLKNSDATVSTLLGDSQSKRIFGFEVKGIWPLLGPIGARLNLTSVAMGSYIHVGICVDENLIPDQLAWQEALGKTASEIFGHKLFEQIFE